MRKLIVAFFMVLPAFTIHAQRPAQGPVSDNKYTPEGSGFQLVLYVKFLLPFNQKITESFDIIGIHNCAWSATLYLDQNVNVPKVAYLDMGINSDLEKTRGLFPEIRRDIMNIPMDVANKTNDEIRTYIVLIAQNYGTFDIVVNGIKPGTTDNMVLGFI